MVIIYSAPAVHIEYKCKYNILARATYVPENVVAAFRHISFQCVVICGLLVCKLPLVLLIFLLVPTDQHGLERCPRVPKCRC